MVVAIAHPDRCLGSTQSINDTGKKPALYWFLSRENQATLLSAEHGTANEYVATCVLFTFDEIRSWFYYRVKMRIEWIVFSVLIYYSKHTMRPEAMEMRGIGPSDLTGIIAWYQRSERQLNNMMAFIRPLESHRNKSNVRRLSFHAPILGFLACPNEVVSVALLSDSRQLEWRGSRSFVGL